MAYTGPQIPDRIDSSKARVTNQATLVPDVSSFVKPQSYSNNAGLSFDRQKAANAAKSVTPQTKKASIENFIEDNKTKYKQLETDLKSLEKQYKTAVDGGYTTQAASLKKKIDATRAEMTKVNQTLASLRQQIRELNAEIAEKDETSVTGTGAGTGSAQGSQSTQPPQDTSAAINLSACKELYFRGEQKFLMETLDIPSNSPGFVPSLSPVASYAQAEELWGRGIATKGRIQTFVPFTSTSTAGTLGGRQLEEFAASKTIGRKAFQFHYNPGSVDMAYGSVNDVDLGYLASGQAVTNFLQALGQVSFEILLNRMPDMKFIDPKAGDFRKSGVNYPRDVYDRSPRTDSKQTNELREIYNKGTMYDLEFLLRILMGGVSFTSQLRGGEQTSDLGFAIPQPVELHLGSRLRYVISVTGLQIRHVIFNERMVPLFSTVSITANRVPADTVTATSLDLSGGQATVGTPANPTIR